MLCTTTYLDSLFVICLDQLILFLYIMVHCGTHQFTVSRYLDIYVDGADIYWLLSSLKDLSTEQDINNMW